jgi:hypothetical protein
VSGFVATESDRSLAHVDPWRSEGVDQVLSDEYQGEPKERLGGSGTCTVSNGRSFAALDTGNIWPVRSGLGNIATKVSALIFPNEGPCDKLCIGEVE